MFLNHVAVYCSSEEKSDLFYGDLFGLEKTSSRVLPGEFVEEIFGVNIELKLINYTNDGICFEVFIGEEKGLDIHRIGHTCLEIDDRETFIRKCESINLKIHKIPRGDSFLLFVGDFDGNLFEIKEKQS